MNIDAWLYLPEGTSQPVPCIVMSTGIGGTKDCILENYAVRFVEAGFAVQTYDYRYFGDSEGEPRQNFDVSFQLDDLRAAIEYARSRDEIDPEKIALWSTSAAGGYGLVLAAEDKRIAAVISPPLLGKNDKVKPVNFSVIIEITGKLNGFAPVILEGAEIQAIYPAVFIQITQTGC